jgi:hypothetical protein
MSARSLARYAKLRYIKLDSLVKANGILNAVMMLCIAC